MRPNYDAYSATEFMGAFTVSSFSGDFPWHCSNCQHFKKVVSSLTRTEQNVVSFSFTEYVHVVAIA